MRAYYLDDLPGDQRLPHDSGHVASLETLAALGVLYWRIPVDAPGGWEIQVNAIADERKYRSRDVVTASRESLGEVFDARMAMFFKEHIHEDEEIRYLLEGSAFFDVREHTTDAWVRCHLEAGDMIILPAGIYHRFTLDENEHSRTLRLFKDQPRWEAHYRGPETDKNPYRAEYLKAFSDADKLTSHHVRVGA
ncbi:1,2-dihydroxy-3-keto-5-methylthiopentene dioxygenase [Trametes gibbosa]|nr:1,2-dihydroxy-3-keto-5-methylthiopentene dioxygenase [Trametes gibbosa]